MPASLHASEAAVVKANSNAAMPPEKELQMSTLCDHSYFGYMHYDTKDLPSSEYLNISIRDRSLTTFSPSEAQLPNK
jgi:hypothetical protein